MKKLLISALAATSALIATPAFAQASGSVSLTGSVAAKCTAIPDLDDSIALGELALANGTVDPAFLGAGGDLSRSFTVRCTSPNPGLSVQANALTTTASGAAGYTGTVHYTATLTAVRAAGGSATVVDQSDPAAATTGSVGSHLANSNNNITVTVSNGNTTTATDLLDAGAYTGSIAIIVSPT